MVGDSFVVPSGLGVSVGSSHGESSAGGGVGDLARGEKVKLSTVAKASRKTTTGDPVLIYNLCYPCFVLYDLPLGSPELDLIRGCGESLEYGEGRHNEQGMPLAAAGLPVPPYCGIRVSLTVRRTVLWSGFAGRQEVLTPNRSEKGIGT